MSWIDILGGFGILTSFALGVISLSRTLHQDKKNLAAENLDGIFEGSNTLMKNLSDDNADLRNRITDLEAELSHVKVEMQREIDTVVAERNDLSHKLLKSQQENAKLITQLGGVNG